ncbi:RNA methyltransferase [Geminocystis sp. CENA526]|uniref:RNA methyltransferase n=1 Tax=Geminocystis sp. CENA526 TaxID=1355871 RepID=UPI003D6EF82A
MCQVKIILVEPAGERNIGSIARVMRNMALNRLTIVKPRCDHLSESARIMAVHGVEVLEKAEIVDSLPQALQGCKRSIATTSRQRDIHTVFETPRQAIPWLKAENITSALIFGPEDRGLSNQELSYAQRFICIPSNPEYPSLNLAQAVGVCAYELYQVSQESVIQEGSSVQDLANIEELEGYYQHLESLLLRVNYLYPHTAPKKMEKLRRIVNRANLTSQELAMIRGILRQVEWSIENNP